LICPALNLAQSIQRLGISILKYKNSATKTKAKKLKQGRSCRQNHDNVFQAVEIIAGIMGLCH
jgi:hypothetical protein